MATNEYAVLQAMGPNDAAVYVYNNYTRIKDDPGVNRWIGENAALYADTVKRLRATPRQGG